MNGAGGKYILNCLASSGSVAVQHKEYALQCLQGETLVEKLLTTLPDHKEQMRNWGNYELGCDKLYNKKWLDQLRNNQHITEFIGNAAVTLDKNDYWLPFVANNPSQLQQLLDYFDNHNVCTVYVDPNKDFIDKAIRLKWPEPHHCLDLDAYFNFQQEAKLLDFDYIMYNWDACSQSALAELEELANFINVKVDLQSIDAYITKYVSLHR